MGDNIMNTEQARKLLEMSRSAFWQARKRGQIEASMQINGKSYYSLTDLAKAIEKPKSGKKR